MSYIYAKYRNWAHFLNKITKFIYGSSLTHKDDNFAQENRNWMNNKKVQNWMKNNKFYIPSKYDKFRNLGPF
jgi:hypothetical protein